MIALVVKHERKWNYGRKTDPWDLTLLPFVGL